MRTEMTPTFTLNIETGCPNDVFRSLDKAGLKRFREQLLDTKQRMFDDDPDSDVMGRFDVLSITDLVSLIRALPPKDVKLMLNVNAGTEKADGFLAVLGGGINSTMPQERIAWWYCDADKMVAGIREKLSVAAKLIGEVL